MRVDPNDNTAGEDLACEESEMSFDPTTCATTSSSSDEDAPILPTTQSVALAAYDVLCQSLHRAGADEEIVVRGNDVHALLFLCDLGLLSVGINPDNGRVED